MTRTVQAILVGATTFALGILASPAVRALPLTVTDYISFVTEDQSMWGPGSEPVVHKEFTAAIIDIDTGPTSIGEVRELSTSIPNPVYLGWKVAYDGCRSLYSASICTNGATINLGFTRIRIPGLGPAPPTTLTVEFGKNGLRITSDIDVEAGFKGSFTLDGGKVDVSYPTSVTLQTRRDAYAAGEIVTLRSFESLISTPTMTTEFSDIDTSLKAYADIDISAGLEAWVAGNGGTVSLVDIDTGEIDYEIFGLSFGNGEIGVRLVELAPIVIDTRGGLGMNLFSVTYPPCPPDADGGFDCPFGIPLADIQIQVPDLDTDATDSNWSPPDPDAGSGGAIVNTQLPIDRTEGSENDLTLIGGGVGFHRTDLVKADVDIDGIISAAAISAGTPIVFGLKAGVPLVVTAEGNLIDFDLGAFFGFGQTLSLEPTVVADLNFSVPIQVETAPGVFDERSTWTMPIGDDFNFIHPGVDFAIEPTYFLDALFTNQTDFLISPVASVAALQLKLSGLAPSILGIDFDAALFQQVFPLVDPITAASVPTDPFMLAGFERYGGSPLLLRTADAVAVPEPPMLALVVAGFALLLASRSRRGTPLGAVRTA
jgi:hypothetical protein